MPSDADVAAKIEEEITRCAKDFKYFSRYLRIVDKKGRLVPLEPNEVQEKFLSSVETNPWIYVLKARQLGLTTIIAARNLWKVLFIPNHKVAVLAHRGDSAQAIFEIYKRYYDHLPDFLQFPTDKSNVRELAFFHGGMVRVMTAQSEGARGTTYQGLHCSEFAFWGDVEKTVAAAFQTAGPNAEIILETTANGLNEANKIWQEENGFDKIFYPWTDNSLYRKAGKTGRLHAKLKKVAEKHGLDKQQLCWAQETLDTKCMNNWNTFMQEYPFTAQMAFITSGERFFDLVFPHAQALPGRREYVPHDKYRVYSLGVDVASGSPSGDYSSYCVMDVTDKDLPIVVATHYERSPPHEFAELVRKEAEKYEALVVVESNTYGLSVLEYLVGREYAYIFRRTHYDKIGARWVEKLGFQTTSATRPMMLSRLHEYCSRGKLVINDERMKAEMNSFVYNEKGKPGAAAGKHDDMIFSHALALMGLDQIEQVKQDVLRKKPSTIQELLQYERATGRSYQNETDDSHFETYGIRSDQTSPIDAALNHPPTRR